MKEKEVKKLETNEERQKEIKNIIERNEVTYEKLEEERMRLMKQLGIKNNVLQQEMLVLQKEETNLVEMIEADKKVIANLETSPYEVEAAEARIEQHEREKEWVTTRLNATERELGLEDRRTLREKIKQK